MDKVVVMVVVTVMNTVIVAEKSVNLCPVQSCHHCPPPREPGDPAATKESVPWCRHPPPRCLPVASSTTFPWPPDAGLILAKKADTREPPRVSSSSAFPVFHSRPRRRSYPLLTAAVRVCLVRSVLSSTIWSDRLTMRRSRVLVRRQKKREKH